MSPVHLVTGPVQTGKTTRLRSWCDDLLARARRGETTARVDGILAPVVSGHRHLLHIPSGEMRDLEDTAAGSAVVTVRRFTFNADVFAWAGNRLLDAADVFARTAEPGWLVVDEIGPLELAGGGLEPPVRELLALLGLGADARMAAGKPSGPVPLSVASFSLVLVIREHLVADVLAHLGLAESDVGRFPFA